MKDFNSYTRENNSKYTKEGGKTDVFTTFSQLASKYEGKNTEEMMQAIIKEAEKSRRNGTLSDKDIDDFAASISPFLTDKQRNMLTRITAKLKSI